MIVPHVESVLTSGREMTMAEGSIDVSDRPRRVETRQARMSSQPPTHDDHDGGASDENADGRLEPTESDKAPIKKWLGVYFGMLIIGVVWAVLR